MPRQPKPYFRKQTKSWYCSIGGKQISLGKDCEAAHVKFHQLMTDRDAISSELVTIYELSQAYLDWCKSNRKKTTYDKHLLYLKSFVAQVGKRMKTAALKQHHLTKWKDGNPSWSDNSANDAISIVQRMINWAVDEGYLDRTPISNCPSESNTTKAKDQLEQLRNEFLRRPMRDKPTNKMLRLDKSPSPAIGSKCWRCERPTRIKVPNQAVSKTASASSSDASWRVFALANPLQIPLNARTHGRRTPKQVPANLISSPELVSKAACIFNQEFQTEIHTGRERHSIDHGSSRVGRGR